MASIFDRHRQRPVETMTFLVLSQFCDEKIGQLFMLYEFIANRAQGMILIGSYLFSSLPFLVQLTVLFIISSLLFVYLLSSGQKIEYRHSILG